MCLILLWVFLILPYPLIFLIMIKSLAELKHRHLCWLSHLLEGGIQSNENFKITCLISSFSICFEFIWYISKLLSISLISRVFPNVIYLITILKAWLKLYVRGEGDLWVCPGLPWVDGCRMYTLRSDGGFSPITSLGFSHCVQCVHTTWP